MIVTKPQDKCKRRDLKTAFRYGTGVNPSGAGESMLRDLRDQVVQQLESAAVFPARFYWRWHPAISFHLSRQAPAPGAIGYAINRLPELIASWRGNGAPC